MQCEYDETVLDQGASLIEYVLIRRAGETQTHAVGEGQLKLQTGVGYLQAKDTKDWGPLEAGRGTRILL